MSSAKKQYRIAVHSGDGSQGSDAGRGLRVIEAGGE